MVIVGAEIQQVLLNLLTNARDALNERYPRGDPDKLLRATARAVRDRGSTWLRLVIEDHGAGIAEEYIGRIFDPFFTTKPRGVGTGLGLSVSTGIVRSLGGTLSLVPSDAAEARFRVELPAADAASKTT